VTMCLPAFLALFVGVPPPMGVPPPGAQQHGGGGSGGGGGCCAAVFGSLSSELRVLFANRQYMQQSACYTMLAGVAFAFPAIQAEIFAPDGLTSQQSSWTNLSFISSGVVLGIVAGKRVRTPAQFGPVLKTLFAVSTVTATLLALVVEDYKAILGTSKAALMAFLVPAMGVMGGCSIGFLGIGLQAASEVAEPVPETISAGLVEWFIQISAAVLTQMSSGGPGLKPCVVVLWIFTPYFFWSFDGRCYEKDHSLRQTELADRGTDGGSLGEASPYVLVTDE